MAEEAQITFDANPEDFMNQPEITNESTVVDSEPAPQPVESPEPLDVIEVGGQTEQEDGNEVQQTEGATETETVEAAGEPEQGETIEVSQEPEVTEITEIQEPAAAETVAEQAPQQYDLPEGVDKLVEFMQETGGTLEDYISLSRDFSSMSDDALLVEYYSKTKPHWSIQDVKDHLEDEFTLEEEYEAGEEMSREDRRKVRNKKEELNRAKSFLEGQKQKYYENIKMNSQQVSQQQQQEAEAQERIASEMRQRVETQNKELFSEQFQGFDFNTGDKKFRIKENANQLYEAQNDLSNVLMEHMNEDGSIKDVALYHKSLYAFRNADKLFSQAYQQGKADALKERAQSTKNIDMTPKTTQANTGNTQGPKISFDVTPPGW